MNKTVQPETPIPDEDYRNLSGYGCIISFIIVVVIFTIAAGLWLFSRS